MVETTRFFETKQVDLATANKAYSLYKLRGGETIVIKALNTNTGMVYIGTRTVSSSNGFPLAKGEGIELVYAPDKDITWNIDVYAVAATAGDDVAFMVVPAP